MVAAPQAGPGPADWCTRRETQLETAAFAGATKFVGCPFQFGDPVAANESITAAALAYAGDQARDSTWPTSGPGAG